MKKLKTVNRTAVGEIDIYKDGQIIPVKLDFIEALQNPTITIAELATGIIASKDQAFVIGARVVQGAIKGNLIKQIGRELKDLREKGKIKEDYFSSNDAQASLNDLLEFIDKEVPDEERFKAMKAIFFHQIDLDTSESERLIARQLLKICGKLNSIDILVLKACYTVSQEKPGENVTSYNDWVAYIALITKLNLSDLIGLSNDKLEESALITPREFGDRSGVKTGRHFRLSDLGYTFCEFIVKY